MKYLSIIVIAFFLFGCQTVGAENGSNQLIVKNEELVKETSEEKKVEGWKVSKSLICISSVKLLAHLKSIGEVPHAIWIDEAFGHSVIMLVNVKTGSLTILEYPSGGKISSPMYEDLACVLSSGIGLNIKPSNEIKIKIMHKGN